MGQEYSAEQLHQKLSEGVDRFYLVDVLPRASYVNRHLPGAISLPLEELRERARSTLPNLDVEVITYCSGPA